MLDRRHGWNASFKPTILGFMLSLLLIVAMYRFVTKHHLAGDLLDLTVIGLATGTVLIQLLFFFHLGLGAKPRWHLITFLFTAVVIFIVIGGSMWIMNNLAYDLMLPMEH